MADVVVKRLGPVTAYADAVAGGFDGTREEFEGYMARIKELDTLRADVDELKEALLGVSDLADGLCEVIGV